jgi:hypothetical protein
MGRRTPAAAAAWDNDRCRYKLAARARAEDHSWIPPKRRTYVVATAADAVTNRTIRSKRRAFAGDPGSPLTYRYDANAAYPFPGLASISIMVRASQPQRLDPISPSRNGAKGQEAHVPPLIALLPPTPGAATPPRRRAA